MSVTKKEYVEWLNEIPVADADLRSNGGRVADSWRDRQGDWLRLNDPIAFQVGWQEWKREQEFAAEQRRPA
jgi:hypothetical protein